MADYNEESREVCNVGNFSVKVDVDVSEALTGLKALSREAREATKSVKALELRSGNTFLSHVTTAHLVEELASRDGKVMVLHPNTDEIYRDYISEIKRISGDYKEMPVNGDLYEAFASNQRVKTLYQDRGCGFSTSAVALSNVVANTYVVTESVTLAKHFRDNLGAKNVLTMHDIKSGRNIKDNETYIFDFIKEDIPFIPRLNLAKIIKVRQEDYYV